MVRSGFSFESEFNSGNLTHKVAIGQSSESESSESESSESESSESESSESETSESESSESKAAWYKLPRPRPVPFWIVPDEDYPSLEDFKPIPEHYKYKCHTIELPKRKCDIRNNNYECTEKGSYCVAFDRPENGLCAKSYRDKMQRPGDHCFDLTNRRCSMEYRTCGKGLRSKSVCVAFKTESLGFCTEPRGSNRQIMYDPFFGDY